MPGGGWRLQKKDKVDKEARHRGIEWGGQPRMPGWRVVLEIVDWLPRRVGPADRVGKELIRIFWFLYFLDLCILIQIKI